MAERRLYVLVWLTNSIGFSSPVRALLPQPFICDTEFVPTSAEAFVMGRIHVLSENVANKIAAGEVVERPASVAKELLENSLDAGSTRVRIQVEAGGKKLIQITDNGCGMVRDDALLAFERHATSKIKNAEDLLSVATLGFAEKLCPRSLPSPACAWKPAPQNRTPARWLKSTAAKYSA